MLEFFVEGGFAMYFLGGFGLASLGSAAWYARRATQVSFRVMLGLGVATAFTTLMGICVDLAAVGHGAAAYHVRHPEQDLASIVLQGLAESLAPGILGFSVLALTALIAALGLYRDPTA